MPQITSISPQRNGKRVNIHLDGKFSFGLDMENYLRFGLKTNQWLTEDEVVKIIDKANFQKIYDRLLKFATLRPRSEKEINLWFKRKKVHTSLFGKLFNRLKQLELVNDVEFSKWWVDQRLAFRPKPKRVLGLELKEKGISGEIISNVLDNTKIDEVKIARKVLDGNYYKWEKLGRSLATKKAKEFLLRKGFSWDVISRVVSIDLDE